MLPTWVCSFVFICRICNWNSIDALWDQDRSISSQMVKFQSPLQPIPQPLLTGVSSAFSFSLLVCLYSCFCMCFVCCSCQFDITSLYDQLAGLKHRKIMLDVHRCNIDLTTRGRKMHLRKEKNTHTHPKTKTPK